MSKAFLYFPFFKKCIYRRWHKLIPGSALHDFFPDISRTNAFLLFRHIPEYVGIQPQSLELGEELSPAVESSVKTLAEILISIK